jgi:hypothetical protein
MVRWDYLGEGGAAGIEEATHIFNGALIESRRTGEPVIVLFE